VDQTDQVSAVIEESDADLEAGFAAVRGGQPAPQTAADPQASAQSAADDTSNPETEPSATAEHGIPNVDAVEPEKKEPTVAELMAQIASLQNTVRNVAGNVGGLKSELQRELQKLTQIRAMQPQDSAAAKGAEKAQQLLLKRVRENWPDFADDLAADLQDSMGAAGAAPSIDPQEIERRVEQKVSQRVEEVERKVASETLDVLVPNWQQDIATRDAAGELIYDSNRKLIPSREFVSWLSSKGDEYSKTFWNTNSAKFLIGAISGFKDSQKQVQQSRTTKQDRLKSAVVPQGRAAAIPQPELDEEAAMDRGWQNVRGGATR
jgi:hypothetical protein